VTKAVTVVKMSEWSVFHCPFYFYHPLR